MKPALKLGLIAGCVAGLVVYGVRTRKSPARSVNVQQWYAALPFLMRLQPEPMQVIEAPPHYSRAMLRAAMDIPLVDPHNDCPGPDFSDELLLKVSLVGRDLSGADFRNAVLCGVDFLCARLDGARFDGARYDAGTRWPERFDPQEHGARLIALHYGNVIREKP